LQEFPEWEESFLDSVAECYGFWLALEAYTAPEQFCDGKNDHGG
jgi:hypothetical protein